MPSYTVEIDFEIPPTRAVRRFSTHIAGAKSKLEAIAQASAELQADHSIALRVLSVSYSSATMEARDAE